MSAPRAKPGEFVHLHLHTEYSLLDGGNQVEKLVARIAELGMKAVAVTDHGNLFGAVAVYQACKDKGIKPILGTEAYVTPPDKPRQDRTYSGGGEGGYHLVLLAQNNEGWNNLLVLASEAYLTGFYYKPRIDRALLEKHSAGLIAINGHLGSEMGEHLLAFHRSGDRKFWEAAVESARWHDRVFNADRSAPPRFYVELQHHVPEQNAINPLLIRLARELDLPLVCDNDAHFLREEDHDAHDTLICISTAKGKNDEGRMRYPREVYVKAPREMEDVFAEYGDAGREALDNTLAIAERCNVELPLGRSNAPAVQIDLPDLATLPRWDEPRYAADPTAWYTDYCAKFELKPFLQPPTPEQMAASKRACDTALRLLAEAGFRWRYGAEAKGDEREAGELVEKRARLARELKILTEKGISAYFLIVWDFVNWGRQRGIPSNARGSGVGTMVGYVLGLSNACPVHYGLLFERFTDPDRSEYPDIDIDLCQDGRGEVIDYVRRKYGHVAQIITFGTLKARAAIRDVGRVLGVSLQDVDKIAKLVPEQLNITIEEALKQEPELRRLRDADARYRQLLDNAIQLEGHTRHAGVHAAGVIVATRPLHEIVPLYKQPQTEGNDIITQWDGPTCEKMGLLKMDFLGLRTLSVIERAKRLIREGLSEGEIWQAVGRAEEFAGPGRGSHPLDLDRIPFDDQKVFELFRRGETTGVFQFESGGMRRLLMEMKPDRLEDLIAANALFRPGPMDLIPDYNRRKHGTEPVPSIHPIVDSYTNETYGVMVYQEQVMQIVHGLGGIKLRDAYTLIKNISKKNFAKIDKERPKFLEGARKQGLTKAQAEGLFELILKFAGYGFNKCVVGSTIVVDARTGERTSVVDLFRRRPDFAVHAVDESGKLRVRAVTDVVWNGRKPVFEVRTRQGKSITATGNHPFLTFDGWRTLADLKPGDRIGAPRRLDIAAQDSWPEHEVVALAGLLAEGNTCHPTCLYFFGNERRLVEDFASAASLFPETVARTYSRSDGRRLEVCVSTGQDARFRKGQRPWNASGDEDGGLAVATRRGVRSGAFRWAQNLGIVGVKAPAKRVPEAVFRLCDSDLELFLGRLWAGDGYLAGSSSSTPFYATSSSGLARDVQLLLLRLGITSGVHTKSFRYRGGTRPGYTVHLVGQDSVTTFLRRVVPHCLGREAQADLLRQRVASAAPGMTSKDTIPAEVRFVVDAQRRRMGLTWRELEERSGVSIRELSRVADSGKRGFRRSTIARLGQFLGSARLSDAAASDIFWDEIVSIEPKGIQDTYDLTVDTDHNFVADGLIVHNSHSTGYAIVAYHTAYLKTYFPNQYMAAFLTYESQAGKASEWTPYLEDCRRTRFTDPVTGQPVKVGVEVRPPDINLSQAAFAVVFEEASNRAVLRVHQGHVRFGLKAIKGAGDKAVEAVIAERTKHGPFTSLFDFCERMPPGVVNKATLESLIKCGAFDGVHTRPNRAAMIASIEQALGAGAKLAADKAAGQGGLFLGEVKAAKGAARSAAAPLARAEPWSEAETLRQEKDTLGFYLSSHPLERWRAWGQTFATTTTGGAKELPQDTRVVLAAMVQSVRTILVRNGRSAGQKMGILTIEDLTGVCEAVLFTEAYSKFNHLAVAEQVVFVLGRLDHSRGDAQVIVDRLMPIDCVPVDGGRLRLFVDEMRLNGDAPGAMDKVAELIRSTAPTNGAGSSKDDGPTLFSVEVVIGTESQVAVLAADPRLRVALGPDLVAKIETALGPGMVKVAGVTMDKAEKEKPRWKSRREED